MPSKGRRYVNRSSEARMREDRKIAKQKASWEALKTSVRNSHG